MFRRTNIDAKVTDRNKSPKKYSLSELFFYIFGEIGFVKFCCWFICVIILALSFAPCSDTIVPVSKRSSFFNSPQTKNHSHKKSDACSPFCVCMCCSAPISLQNASLIYTIDIAELSASKYSLVHPRKVVSAPSDIWQPPQLC